MNNKGTDQTAWMRRLICASACAFVVRIWHKQVFSWRGPSSMLSKNTYFDINFEWLKHDFAYIFVWQLTFNNFPCIKHFGSQTYYPYIVCGVCILAVILLPTLGYSLCLSNLGINPQIGKKILYQKLENTGLLLIGKQPVFGCKISKIKSLACDFFPRVHAF